ncbi:MAG: Uma2 family endonuclease [Candidatus Binatia bacterium]
MSDAGPESGHISVQRYFEMGECGILSPEDRVELLDGLIVAMAPPSPPHDSVVNHVQYVLLQKLGFHVAIRVQSSFLAGDTSVLQPDIAVVPGRPVNYFRRHPGQAHLIVEVAQSSVSQDRHTKSAIYARAGVPCYWIVNVRDHCVEVYREPDRWKSRYDSLTRATGSDLLAIDAFPDVTFQPDELLPPSLAGDLGDDTPE